MASDRFHASGIGDPAGFLLPNETMVVSVRRHIMCLAATFLETLGFIAMAAMITYVFEYSYWVRTLAGIIFLGAVLRLAYVVLEYRMERFVITDRRLMLRSGVLSRSLATLPMTRVTDFTYDKPLVGQILGYGTFVVESAGQDQALSAVSYLPHPDELYQKLMGILFSTPRAGDPPPPPVEEPTEIPEAMLAEPVVLGRDAGAATAYPDFSDAPTGPIARVMVNDALAYPAYDEGDLDGDGTGTPDATPGRPLDRSVAGPDNPVNPKPSPRWARRTRPPHLG